MYNYEYLPFGVCQNVRLQQAVYGVVYDGNRQAVGSRDDGCTNVSGKTMFALCLSHLSMNDLINIRYAYAWLPCATPSNFLHIRKVKNIQATESFFFPAHIFPSLSVPLVGMRAI